MNAAAVKLDSGVGAEVIPLSRGSASSAAPRVPQSQADWRRFYDENWRWIYGLVRRVGGSDIDVEDAVQDIFVVLASKIDSFEGRSQLKTWVYRICLNVTSEHRRKRRRQRRIEQAATLISSWREPSPSAHRTVELRDDAHLANAVLGRMSEKKREVFVLREIEQLSGDEVAEVLDIPTATVRTRLYHARLEFTRLVERMQAKGRGREP